MMLKSIAYTIMIAQKRNISLYIVSIVWIIEYIQFQANTFRKADRILNNTGMNERLEGF